MSHAIKIAIFICVAYLQISNGAKILGIFPIAAKSHYTLGNSLMRGLAQAGHDVTMVSPHSDTLPVKRGTYTNVILTGFAEKYDALMEKMNPFEMSKQNPFTYLLDYQKPVTVLIEKVFQDPNVQALLNSNQTFDVVIVEQVTCEALKYFAHHFNAHLVLFSSVRADSKINYVVGNPTMVSYTPQVDTTFSKDMNLYQRFYNFQLHVFEAMVYHYSWLPFQNALIQKHFPGAPSLIELNYNVSLILVNSHESTQPSAPLVPNIIPIGGFHVKKPKKLPKKLQKYLDDATEGVIYVSFGSTVKATVLPERIKQTLLKTFGSVKEKVLWKWEGDDIENTPGNVNTEKWFPQMDVLAHPNVKLFITQGGLLSITETIYNGVPVLVLPVFGDQPTNAQNAVSDGYGLSMSISDPNLSEAKLVPMIEELLNNPKFRENALKRSELYRDREVDPLQRAVYWLEYVIRHKGAPHLRVWGLQLPWYQHYSLDVLTISVLSLVLVFVLSYKCFKCLLCIVKKRSNKKGNKNKND